MRPLSSRQLTRLFSSVVAASAAAIGGAACDSDPTTTTIDTTGFEPVACGPSGRIDFLNQLVLPVPVDYLELRPVEGSGGPVGTTESAGDACATATNVQACLAAIEAAEATSGFSLGDCVDYCPEYVLVVNTGDTVETLATREAVRDLVVPVDGPIDAVFLAMVAGYSVACDEQDRGVKEVADGYEVLGSRTTAICEPVETTLYRLHVKSSGEIVELESAVESSVENACIGRRPVGLARATARGRTLVGAHLARIAHLEAASVFAFDQLGRELEAHGAPARMRHAARRARADEIRHAAVVTALARRYGALPPRPVVLPRPVRDLEAVALENAVEGCVREAYGALVGAWQATFAGDRRVRAAMRTIARDEARHAALSLEVDAWIAPRMSRAARRRVATAKLEAFAALRAEASRPVPPDLVRTVGLPDARASAELAERFAGTVLRPR